MRNTRFLWAAFFALSVSGGAALAQSLHLLHSEIVAETPLGTDDADVTVGRDGRVRAVFSECLKFDEHKNISFGVKYAVREGPGQWSQQLLNPDEGEGVFVVFVFSVGGCTNVVWTGYGNSYHPGGPLWRARFVNDSLVARESIVDTVFSGQATAAKYAGSAVAAAYDFHTGASWGYHLFRLNCDRVQQIDFPYDKRLEVTSICPMGKDHLCVAGLWGHLVLGFACFDQRLGRWAAPSLPGAPRAIAPRVGTIGDKVLLFWENGKNGRAFPDLLWWTIGPPDGPFAKPDTLRSVEPPGVVLAPTVFSFRDRWLLVFWDECTLFGQGGQCRTMYRIFDGTRWTPAQEFLPEGMVGVGAPKGKVDDTGLLHLIYGGWTGSIDVVVYTTARIDFPSSAQRVEHESPEDFGLQAPYPNPFNGVTEIRFTLARPRTASLCVVDVRGRVVRRLGSGRWAAGPHALEWDGTDESGEPSPSGVYIVRLEAGGQVATRKVVLVR